MIKLDYPFLPKFQHPHSTNNGRSLYKRECIKWRRLIGHEKNKFPKTIIENADVTFIRKTRLRISDKFLVPSFAPLLEGLVFNKFICSNAKVEYKWQSQKANDGCIEIIVRHNGQ